MKKNKLGQTTMFVIIAIIVVALAVLIYMFYPKIKSSLGLETQSPSQFIQTCLEEDIVEAVDTLSLQGGSIRPEHYIVYNGENIEYLCYTNEFYETCVMQQPLLKKHIETEIESYISNSVRKCFYDLEENYKDKGYAVSLRTGGTEVELLPKRIVTSFNHTLTLTKGSSNTYDRFRVVLNNNLYELVSITNSILNWEARYGDSETTTYMDYYHDLKVEKKKQIEGSTIYILTDRNNLNKFQFASRSVVWPSGYE
ncbi:MAG: hypothetical protein ABIH59_01205 [archaeon]